MNARVAKVKDDSRAFYVLILIGKQTCKKFILSTSNFSGFKMSGNSCISK